MKALAPVLVQKEKKKAEMVDCGRRGKGSKGRRSNVIPIWGFQPSTVHFSLLLFYLSCVGVRNAFASIFAFEGFALLMLLLDGNNKCLLGDEKIFFFAIFHPRIVESYFAFLIFRFCKSVCGKCMKIRCRLKINFIQLR